MPLLKRCPATMVALALLALASGCGDSPTGPRPLGAGVLAVGSVFDGTITSMADTAHFSLVLTTKQDALVYLMAKGDWLRLEVRDSTGKLVGAASDMFNTTNPEARAAGIIPASPFRYHVDVSMVQGTAPSDYEIRVVAASNAPEHVPPTMSVGTIVTGEDLDHTYDADTFTVSVDHDQLVDLYLRKAIHTPTSITARLSSGDVYYAIGTTAGEADTVLGAVGSGRFTLRAGVSYTIRVGYDVTYDPPDTGSTPYELLLQKVDPAPEGGPASLVPGDTIHESIDYLGDLDEFTLIGAPGQKFNLFADAGGTAPHRIIAQLIAGNAGEPSVSAVAGGAPLATNATGTFTIPPNGTMTVRVTDDAPNSERGHVGPYRLFAYAIDSGTESASAELALDRATNGSIEMLGDGDVYHLAVATDTAVNIVVRRPKQASVVALMFTLRDAAGALLATTTLGYLPTPGDTAALGTRTLHPGNYTLAVMTTSSTAGGFTGGYEILPRSINRAPESGPATIAVGDTVRGESLDVAGDVDQFAVMLNAGDSVYVYMKPASPALNIGAGLRRLSDGTFFGTDAYNYAGMSADQSRLFVAPTAGAYAVEVSGQSLGVDQGETGAYTVALPRITAAPENRPAAIALGDTVAGAIDVTGDVDDYTLAAAPGTEVTGAMQSSVDCRYCGAISFIDPATGEVLKQAGNSFAGFGRVTVPASGALRIRVGDLPGCYSSCYGPSRRGYQLWVVPVNRAPESRAAAFALGDTVSGEAIDPYGDIDEFTFDAAAGDTVNLYFQTPLGTSSYDGLTIALVDRTTGATLGTLTSDNPTANLEDIALTRVVLPSTGSYLIRVEGTNEAGDKGVYRFRVAKPSQ